MKKKLPEWWPKNHIHNGWYTKSILTREIVEDTKSKLGKIGIKQFQPFPTEIFQPFSIDPDSIKMVLVNSTYPLTVPLGSNYEQYPAVLKDIWQKLSDSEGWECVEDYCQCDLSDFLWCMKLTTNLTTNEPNIWKDLMHNLFTYFGESTDKYLFVFCDEQSFNLYAKYVAKIHEVHYGFDPDSIKEYFKNQWGIQYGFGLPF